MFLLSLLTASVFGVALLRVLFCRGGGSRQRLVECALGPGVGLALLSAVRFWWLVLGLSVASYCWTEAVLVVAAVVLAARAPRPAAEAAGQDSLWGVAPAAALVAGQLALAGLGFWYAYAEIPDGMWDAWCFWNTKARFLSSGSEHWRLAIDPAAVSHPDYPLLLPLTVVRAWDWNSGARAAAGFVVAAFFLALTAWLLLAAVWAARGPIQGFLAAAVYLSTSLVFHWGPSQYADIPLGYYYLAATACLVLGQERPAAAPRWLAVLGLCLSAAAWTKNEGFPWLVLGLAGAGLLAVCRGRKARAWALLAGAVPLVITLAAFKMYSDVRGDLFGAGAHELRDKVVDTHRHALIRWAARQVAPLWLPCLAAWLLVVGLRRPPAGWATSAVAATMILGILGVYYGIYLITPHDLAWHLESSLDRLILQVWPAIVFLFFYHARTLGEVLARGPAPGAATPLAQTVRG